jgi:hypothetical protein
VPPKLLANDPPAPPSDHIAAVAPPPNEPPKAAVVAPWHIADTAPPTFTVGSELTITEILLLVAGLTHGVRLDVNTTLITFPIKKVSDVKVFTELFDPTFKPFICH